MRVCVLQACDSNISVYSPEEPTLLEAHLSQTLRTKAQSIIRNQQQQLHETFHFNFFAQNHNLIICYFFPKELKEKALFGCKNKTKRRKTFVRWSSHFLPIKYETPKIY